MKKIATSILMVASVNLIGQIPDYFGNNPKWHVGEWEIDEFGLNETENCIIIDGDSTIGSYTYKVFKFEYNCSSTPTPPIIGLYRQEGRSIYRYWYNTDSLFISYELNVGDTLNSLYPDVNVDAIDSILVGSEYRHVFRIDTLNSEKLLIEGIGTRYGHENCQGYWFELGYSEDGDHTWHGLELYTYSENGIILYGMDNCSALTLNENKNHQLSIFPNPSNDFLTIKSSSAEISSIVIIDSNGNNVVTESLQANKSILDVSFLADGVYIVRIIFQNGKSEIARLVKN